MPDERWWEQFEDADHRPEPRPPLEPPLTAPAAPPPTAPNRLPEDPRPPGWRNLAIAAGAVAVLTLAGGLVLLLSGDDEFPFSGDYRHPTEGLISVFEDGTAAVDQSTPQAPEEVDELTWTNDGDELIFRAANGNMLSAEFRGDGLAFAPDTWSCCPDSEAVFVRIASGEQAAPDASSSSTPSATVRPTATTTTPSNTVAAPTTAEAVTSRTPLMELASADCVESAPIRLPDDLLIVDCADPHGGEVIEQAKLLPDQDAAERCAASLELYTGGGLQGPISIIWTTRTDADGVSEYLCMVGFGELRTGSVRA
jgi:hypothetical protein